MSKELHYHYSLFDVAQVRHDLPFDEVQGKRDLQDFSFSSFPPEGLLSTAAPHSHRLANKYKNHPLF